MKKTVCSIFAILLIGLTAVTASSGNRADANAAGRSVQAGTRLAAAEELSTESFEYYSPLDELGRCGPAEACIGVDLMPTEERGSIGMIKPTGWNQNKYPGIVDSNPPYLYNRCHLIGYQLTGENANERNLITGTRYMNVEEMLPYENKVAEYVKSSGNHVYYKVTPVFTGTNLLCDGVRIEAHSVEDSGKALNFNVFCENKQPGVDINYSDGTNKISADAKISEKAATADNFSLKKETSGKLQAASYVANTNTKKFHYPDCSSVSDMKEKNKMYFNGSREELINQGYVPCKRCNP
ncbi:DNA/RNA non-specific endonuclease [Lachnospiraceae bacterium C1.1]|nr:DNA/RNA non-specific endonuclease [Lachnospiraceae bacterium C1.1]